jgi:hypothetical protein
MVVRSYPLPTRNNPNAVVYDLGDDIHTWQYLSGLWKVDTHYGHIYQLDAKTGILYNNFVTMTGYPRQIPVDPAVQHEGTKIRYEKVKAFLDAHPELK